MIPVNKYVDMNHPQFKNKTNFEIWHMLDDVTRQMVTIEYLAEQLDNSIQKLREKKK